MAKLVPLTPFAGLLPRTIGTVTLAEVRLTTAQSVAPFIGQVKTVSTALKRATVCAFPEPGQALTGKDGARALWIAPGRALFIDCALPDLDGLAAVTDQADGIAALTITGPDTVDILARLVPLDLRARAFPVGTTARTLVGHMMASLSCIGEESIEIMVFRSMAGTLAHELTNAATHIAARARLRQSA